ncbi:MAG: hypothetical protein BWY51_00808 [Parcubacteria group bacterium ADurb.Bin316]|nr:MAG: hypothetical protein BWY51_00808 [Parcubacteria group bacterium ADurb.Bin316]
MRITIFGSISNAKKIYAIKAKLEKAGHIVYSHELMKKYAEGDRELKDRIKKGHHKVKIKHNTFRWYYNAIKKSDAILVCNFKKHGIPGYIGGSVLFEISHAYILNKKIYLLHNIPKIIYYQDEIKAVQPTVLKGNLGKIINQKF